MYKKYLKEIMKPGGIRPIRKLKFADLELRMRPEGELASNGVIDNSKILNKVPVSNTNNEGVPQIRNASRQRNEMTS